MAQAQEPPFITPDMIADARVEFRRWMVKWDYLADGIPGDSDVDELLSSILVRALRDKVDAP